MEIKIQSLSGRFWAQTSDHDSLVINELEKLNLRRYYKPLSSDYFKRRNQRMLLRYLNGQAILFWRRKSFLSGKNGIKCVLFVNNSEKPSIELLQDAIQLAKLFWIESPFFVHINPKLFPKDAEKAFIDCGWRYSGKSKEGFQIYYHIQR